MAVRPPHGLRCSSGRFLPLRERCAGFTLLVPVPSLPGTVWKLDLLASPGTAIFAAAALIAANRAALARANRAGGSDVLASAPVLPVVNMLAMFALCADDERERRHDAGARSGRRRRAKGLSVPEPEYLSWVGAGITGSNTASNALLGRLQSLTALELGLNPVLTAALASAAAALGKMIAPQVIAAAVAAGAIPGEETRLLRVGLVHGLFWTGLIGVAGALLAG